jgi:PDZ domain-containing protein
MKRSTSSLLVSGALLVALVAVAGYLPVPYVLLRPGPTYDALGEVEGTALVRVEGARTFPVDGELLLTTVTESGGPYGNLTLGEALWGWWSEAAAVVPERLLYPPQLDRDEVKEQNTEAFVDSQANATAAALTFLDEPTRDVVIVASVDPDGASADVLEPGDEIVAVDGTAVTSSDQAADLIGASAPGEEVAITIKRDGTESVQRVTLEESADDPERGVAGITVKQTVQGERVTVEYDLDDVGGPSAGLMFSLSIVDQLTRASLTGGRTIAGTGTIAADGQVGPIGGIQQKVVGARRDGADYFLTPSRNCADAVAAAPDGLTLVEVSTLEGAVAALDAIDAGRSVPRCEAG